MMAGRCVSRVTARKLVKASGLCHAVLVKAASPLPATLAELAWRFLQLGYNPLVAV